jgi:hypothetical protein
MPVALRCLPVPARRVPRLAVGRLGGGRADRCGVPGQARRPRSGCGLRLARPGSDRGPGGGASRSAGRSPASRSARLGRSTRASRPARGSCPVGAGWSVRGGRAVGAGSRGLPAATGCTTVLAVATRRAAIGPRQAGTASHRRLDDSPSGGAGLSGGGRSGTGLSGTAPSGAALSKTALSGAALSGAALSGAALSGAGTGAGGRTLRAAAPRPPAPVAQ